MDDDILFPAYSDYIRGIITRPWIDGHESVIIPHKAPSSASIYSDGEVFGPASLRRPSSPAALESHRGPLSPATLDLRSPPMFPALTKIIPHEHVHPAPPAPDNQGSSPTEPSRRKLFGTPSQPEASARRSPTPSQQLLHSLRRAAKSQSTPRRRGRPRKATHPSLRQASPAIDGDSGVCRTAPSDLHVPSIRSTTQTDEEEAHATPRLHHSSFDSTVASKSRPLRLNGLDPVRSPAIALIRPGELLNQGCFAVLPLQQRQQINARIAQIWNFASAHSDPRMQQDALSQLAAASAYVYKMLQNQESDKDVRAQQGKQGKQTVEQQQQSPGAHGSQLAQTGAEMTAQLYTRIDRSFNRYLAAVRMCQMPPPHDPTALHVVKTYPEFRQSLSEEGLWYLDTLVAEANTRGDLTFGSLVQHNANVELPLITQQTQAPSWDAPNQHQQVGQNAYYRHPPVPQQQQQPLSQSQRRYSALLQAQREVPVATVSDAVRHFVNQHIPKYFEAVEYLKQPPKICDPAIRQKAHIFMDRFDKALPPEGHDYLMEIVRRVAIDKSAGMYD